MHLNPCFNSVSTVLFMHFVHNRWNVSVFHDYSHFLPRNNYKVNRLRKMDNHTALLNNQTWFPHIEQNKWHHFYHLCIEVELQKIKVIYIRYKTTCVAHKLKSTFGWTLIFGSSVSHIRVINHVPAAIISLQCAGTFMYLHIWGSLRW